MAPRSEMTGMSRYQWLKLQGLSPLVAGRSTPMRRRPELGPGAQIAQYVIMVLPVPGWDAQWSDNPWIIGCPDRRRGGWDDFSLTH